MKPQFKHDCKVCIFLGHYQEYDVYICPQHGYPTIVARYGNKGHEYKSGLSIHSKDEVLLWGAKESFAMGYLVFDFVAK